MSERAGASSGGRAIRRWLNRTLSRDLTAWVVLTLTVAGTGVAWRLSEQDLAQRARQRFQSLAARESEVILQRMRDYEQVLRGGAALMYASPRVTREDWRAYVAALELERTLPGIQGTGFSLMVPRASKQAHEREVRAEGFPAYRITPPGERDPYSSIVFIEPFTARNLRAFGFDMYSEPVRREAMDRARDTGEAALSGKVTLVQETESDVQSGFLMYFPVYRGGGPSGTLEERRAALRGFVYSPFRAGDLMRAIFRDPAKDLEVELFDGPPSAEGLLFASEPGERVARFSTDVPTLIGGREWTARFRSSAQFEQRTASSLPTLILYGGVAFDGLLFLVLLGNAQHRRETRSAARALERSRDSYATLMENVPGTVFRLRVGRPSRLEHLSHGIAVLTGEPPERFVSGELSYGALVHPEDRDRVRRAVRAAIARRAAYDVEYRISSPRGGSRWVGERGRASVGEVDGEVRIDGVVLDVTAAKLAEMRVAEAMRAAEAANAAKSAFLANMSHEIRTPLNAILGLAQVLERSAGDGEQREVAGRIRTAGGVLLRGLNDVLDFSKIEAGQLDIERRPFRLGLVLDNLASLMGASALAKGLALRVDAGEAGALRVIGDAVRIEQVLLNLVGNAIKFTAEGEVRVAVTVPARDEASVRVRFEVVDQGIGIAEDKLPLLFTPFTQADGSITRRFGGTGLGLSICKRLVELMGGTIGVSSREGEGSTFRFELPFERAPEAQVQGAPERAPRVPGPTAHRLTGLRVLVADDSETNLDLFARLLALEGAIATRVGDGRQVVELLAARPDAFDAVLMDMQMPVLDGIGATHAIRGELGLADLPVIACSAGTLAQDAERARAAGVDDFVTKPVDHEELVAALLRRVRPTGPAPGPAQATRGDAPASAFPEIAGIDRGRVERLLRGDRDFFLKALRRFGDESSDLPIRLRRMIDAGDATGAASALHRLRGAAGNIGASALAADARALEDALRAGEAVPLQRLSAFTAQLDALLKAAAPWIATPPVDASPAGDRAPARAPVAAGAGVDPRALDALRVALKARKLSAARRHHAALAPALPGTLGADRAAELARALDALRFDEALALLEALG